MKIEINVCQDDNYQNIIKIKTKLEININKEQGNSILTISKYNDKYKLSFFYQSGDKIALDYISSALVYYKYHIKNKEEKELWI